MNIQIHLKALAEDIKTNIDNFCVRKWNKGPRSHLGGSEIGKPCERFLWYKFRWCDHKVETGQKYRLFNRGHFEEPRFKMYLEGIGFDVQEFDKALWFDKENNKYFVDKIKSEDWVTLANPNVCLDVSEDNTHIEAAFCTGIKFDKGDRQIQISGAKGHFGGSIDGVATINDLSTLILTKNKDIWEWFYSNKTKFLCEYKTHATGAKFTTLAKNGCELEKYIYFCQQSIYGYKLGIQYSLFLTVNKNDDDLYIEVIELNHKLGKELEEKAERIIFSQIPPERIAMSKDHYDCKYCDMKDICWGKKQAMKNCRSCKKCVAIEEANWYCELYQQIIPKEFVKIGCDGWATLEV